MRLSIFILCICLIACDQKTQIEVKIKGKTETIRVKLEKESTKTHQKENAFKTQKAEEEKRKKEKQLLEKKKREEREKKAKQFTNKVFMLINQRKYADAIVILTQQITNERDRQRKIGYCVLTGDLYFQLNNETKALDYYDKILQIDQKNSLAYFKRGVIFKKRSATLKKAIEDFTRSLKLGYSKKDEIYVNIAFCYKSIAQFQAKNQKQFTHYLQLAMENYEKALKHNTNNMKALMNFADIHFTLGNYQKAFIFYSQIYKVMKGKMLPEVPLLTARLGHTLHRLEKHREAILLLKNNLALIPKIRLRENLENITGYRAGYVKAFLSTSEISTNLYIAECYLKLEEAKQAKKYYEAVIKIAKGFKEDSRAVKAFTLRAQQQLKKIEKK